MNEETKKFLKLKDKNAEKTLMLSSKEEKEKEEKENRMI